MYNQHMKELLERSIATIEGLADQQAMPDDSYVKHLNHLRGELENIEYMEVKLSKRQYKAIHKALDLQWLSGEEVRSQQESDLIKELMCYKFGLCQCVGLSHRDDCEFHVIPF